MPQRWKDLVSKIRKNLQGKTNPRTKKSYSESDIYAIAMAQYKKMYGSTPKKDEMISFIKEDNPDFLLLEYYTPINEIKDGTNLEQLKEGKITVRGIALEATTSRNKVKYIPEEMEKSAHTLIGTPILNSHNTDDVFNTLGKVTEAHYDTNTQTIPFTADIMDTRAQEYIKDGRITHVSIGAHAQELINEDENSDVVTAKGIEFLELSFVPIAGVKNATITQAITEKYDFIKEINKIYEEIQNEETQGEIMEDETKKYIDEKFETLKPKEEVKTEMTENPLLKENLELKAKLDEIAKKEKNQLVESVLNAELKAGWIKENQKETEKAVLEKLNEDALNLLSTKIKEQEEEPKAEPKAEVGTEEEKVPTEGLMIEKFRDGATIWRMPTDPRKK